MSRRARIKREVFTGDGPTPEQIAKGDTERRFVTHAETATKSMAHVRESAILDKWMREGGVGFGDGACNVIRDFQFYWLRMGSPRLCAQYGERIPRGESDGVTQADAMAQIDHMKRTLGRDFPKPYWDVFENCVRNLEPAGVAGSRMAKNTAGQIASARHIVGMIASFIAAKLGY